MKLQIKWLALGFGLSYLLLAAVVVAAFMFLGHDNRPVFRDQILASGKIIKVTSFHLAWGVEHEERRTSDDVFAMEYVSLVGHADQAALDREILEVFELIQPISDQWGFKRAEISSFPTTQRKGRYFIYSFTKTPEGKWTHKRESAKVFVNDL